MARLRGDVARYLLSFLKPHLPVFVAGLAMLFAANVVFLAFPFLMGRLVDELTGEGTWILEGIAELSVALLAVLFVRAVLNFGQTYAFGVVSNRVSRALRNALYGRILVLPTSFFDTRRTGELISRLSNDVGQLEHAISDMLAGLVRQLVVLCFGVAIVFYLAPQLSVFMIAIVPAVALLTMRLGRTIRRRSRETQDLIAESTTVAEEGISGVSTVRAFTAEPYEARRYGAALDAALSKALDTVRYRAGLGAFIGFFVMGALVLVIWYGASLVETGGLAVGDLVSFVIYTGFIGGSVAGLGGLVTRLQRVLGASERVVEIMRSEPEPGRTLAAGFGGNHGGGRPRHEHEAAGAAGGQGHQHDTADGGAGESRQHDTAAGNVRPGHGEDAALERDGRAHHSGPGTGSSQQRDAGVPDISFERVDFAYPSRPDVPVLEDIAFSLHAREHVALVGPSGSGKSSIVRLLLRFYDPVRGRLLCGRQDIREFNVETWRSRFAVVPQEVMLFGGSIADNIRYGRPSADDEEVRSAADEAFVLEFASRFPDGLGTVVGERGVQLSGGQRQRVAVARAMLRNPEVLILDEATSSLDAESERTVHEALERLMAGRTTLVIAHRLATVQEADRILVLDRGNIVEQGTHRELSRKEDGLYAGLVRMQNLGDAE